MGIIRVEKNTYRAQILRRNICVGFREAGRSFCADYSGFQRTEHAL